METFGVIGVGNIASAILTGVINSGYITPEKTFIYDPDCTKTQAFATAYGVQVCDSAADVVNASKYVLIAVKPSIVESVLKTVSGYITNQCVISVAAGISISFISSLLPEGTSIIRAMPNTPLMFGKGAVGYALGKNATECQANFVKGIFSCAGIAVKLEEKLLDAVTAVSGSSPAFVFRFIDNMVAEGTKLGLPESVAKELVIQTVIGSAHMLSESNKTAEQLIRMVASPGGTTEAGLSALDCADFDFAVRDAINKAHHRSIELIK